MRLGERVHQREALPGTSQFSREAPLTSRLSDHDNKRRALEATDIVRLVAEHVTLRPKGREFACLCPFHDDHNPSCYIVPAKQIFHCFVCGAGGNAIDFVMRYHGMAFREALDHLASRAGIELVWSRRTQDPASHAPDEPSRTELYEANALAWRFFRGVLKHPEHGSHARACIERRGISPDMVEAFGLGAAPDRWDGLALYARSADADLRALTATGLIKPRESAGGAYDILRHRLVFPIFDLIGRPVAFGGRKLRDEDEPKYLNSPESTVFDKGSTLFGLKQAMRTIQSTRTAILTEGYTDVIACHQHGFTNALAALGTALTPKHAAALRRLADRLILLFDGDEAGQRASDRALEVFFTEPVDVRIAVMRDAKDPDELLKLADGPQRFRAILDDASDLLDYRYQRLKKSLRDRGFGPGSTARITAVENEIDRLLELGLRRLSPIRQQAVIARLSTLAEVDHRAIARTIEIRELARRTGPERAPARSLPPEPAAGSLARRSPLEHALSCLLTEPALAETDPHTARDVLDLCAYASPPIPAIAEAFSRSLDQDGDATREVSELILRIEDPQARSFAARLVAEVERLTDGQRPRRLEHWRACAARARFDSSRPEEGTAILDLGAALERTRIQHEHFGGNPRAMPRPRSGTGHGTTN